MNRNLKLIVIGNLNYPYSGAPTNRVHAYAKGLVEEGYEVLVICTGTPFRKDVNFKEYGKFEGVDYVYSSGTYLRNNNFFLRNFIKVYGKLNGVFLLYKNSRKMEKLAILEFATTFSYELLLFLVGKIICVPIIREENEVPLAIRNNGQSSVKKFVELEIRPKLYDGIILISNYLNELLSPLIRKNAKILFIPILVDFERFSISRSKSNQKKYLAYCGYMGGDKDGVDILIQSFSLIAEKYCDLFLYLIGHAPKNEMDKLIDSVKKNNLSERIIFTGEVQRDKMPEFLSNSIALTLARPNNTQAKGGFPTKLGEYLATGNPVIVTDVGEIHHFLTDNKNIFFAEPGNPQSFAEKLDYVLSNPKISESVGKEGKNVARANFNYRVASKKIIDFINSLNEKYS